MKTAEVWPCEEKVRDITWGDDRDESAGQETERKTNVEVDGLGIQSCHNWKGMPRESLQAAVT